MPARTLHVKLLIERLAITAMQPLDNFGFGKMSEQLSIDTDDHISQKYLGDIYRTVKRLHDKEIGHTRVRADRLDIIARHLGYRDFLQFSQSCEKNVPLILRALCGNWWSYVRSNSGNHILKAPVRIMQDAATLDIIMDLKGEERLFTGILSSRGNCAFTYLDSDKEKRIFLVLKLGSKNMNVLQGTFCGVSSNFDPIAGREVFVREKELSYENMSWQKLKTDDPSIELEIRQFFAIHEQNCLKVSRVSDFELSDLIQN